MYHQRNDRNTVLPRQPLAQTGSLSEGEGRHARIFHELARLVDVTLGAEVV